MAPINQIANKGISLVENVARYVKCGERSILEIKPLQGKINIEGLRLAPSATSDTLQLSKRVNNIRVELGKKRGSSCLRFYDGEQQVGYATYYINRGRRLRGEVPDEWFVDSASLPKIDLTDCDALTFHETKPFMHIEEFMMRDKLGMEAYAQRASGKKYGTMCMQRVLEHAEKLGLGSRIELDAAIHGSAVNPAKFYAKIGFNSPPGKVAHRIDDINYSKERIERIRSLNWSPEEKAKEIARLQRKISRGVFDGRYYDEATGGRMWLEAPDVLKNYPL